MSAILGIDPGITGAVALIIDGKLLKIWDIPVTEKLVGKGNEINPYLLSDVIKEAIEIAGNEPITAHVEDVNARPGQNVTAIFGFGMSFGMIRGVLASHGISTRLIRASIWKKQAHLIKKDKDASRGVAISHFPEAAHYLKRAKDHNRAEAILLASYNH